MPDFLGYYIKPEVTRFVILFIERDGSTYLTSMLQSHPNIKAEYEKFSVLRLRGASSSDQLNWLVNLFVPPLISRYAAIGFKTKLIDVLDREGFIGILHETDCKIIQMERRNHVKAVVSKINARRIFKATGNWNLYDEADRQPPIILDIPEFDRYIKERNASERELNQFVNHLRLPTLKITYEELLTNKEQVLQDIFEFIHVKSLPVEGKPLKATEDDLRKVISNFDDLKSYYRGTVYETMFEEVLV